MNFRAEDVVRPSGLGRTETWPPYIRGKVIRVDE